MSEQDAAEVARAQRLLDQVKLGKTVFFKTSAGWLIIGPANDIEVGRTVTATKASGDTTVVVVREILAERTVQDISTRTARFVNATAEAEQPALPVYQVIDRQAAAVGGALGRTSSTAPGYCHYCGLELDPRGNCAECV